MIRILLVDDQNLVQQGIKYLLEQDMELTVIGTVTDGRSALQQISQTRPDIVLLDIEMPGMNGITTTKHIKRISPETKVIILSSHEDKKYVTQALMAGARGYILKSSLMTDLKQAILAVCNGYSQIDSRLLAKVFDPQNIKIRKNTTSSTSEKTAPKLENTALKKSTVQSQNYAPSSISKVDKEELKSQEHDLEKALEPEQDSSTISTQTSESKTVLPSAPSNPNSSSSPKLGQKFPAQDPSDAVVLQPVSQNSQGHQFKYDIQQAPNSISEAKNAEIFENNTAIQTEEKPSISKYPVVPVRRKNRSLQSSIISYWSRLLNHPRVSSCQPIIERLQSRLLDYKAKCLSFVKQKRKRTLLWNIGLVFLGLVVVIFLSR